MIAFLGMRGIFLSGLKKVLVFRVVIIPTVRLYRVWRIVQKKSLQTFLSALVHISLFLIFLTRTLIPRLLRRFGFML